MRGGLGHIGGAFALALSLAIGIAACGDDAPAAPASVAPPDAPLYAEFVLRPEGDDADAIDSLAERIGGIGDPGAAIVDEVEASLAANGLDLTYSDDIEPWLGERGAVFVRSFELTEVAGGMPDFALAIQTDDPDATSSFLEDAVEQDSAAEESRSYGGYDYFFTLDDGGVAAGLIGDLLVLGTEDSFKVAVDAAEGESLAESEEYMERTDALAADPLATLYLEPGAAIAAAIASGEIPAADARVFKPLLAGPLSEPLAVGLSATTEAASIELAAMIETGDVSTESALLESLPGESWLAAAAPDLGEALGRTFDQLESTGLPAAGSIQEAIRAATGRDLRSDLIPWLGDTAVFVGGTAPPAFRAGLVAETSDPDGPRAILRTAQALAEAQSGLRSSAPPQGADYGFSLGLPGLGGGAEAGVVGDRLVAAIGTTVGEVLDPAQTLGDEQGFQDAVDALGDAFAPGLYVHLPSFFEVAEQGGSADDPDYQRVAPYLDAFETLIAGSRVEDGLAVSRLTVALAPE